MKNCNVLNLIGRKASVKNLAPISLYLLIKFARKISPTNLTFIAIKNVSTNIRVFMLIKVYENGSSQLYPIITRLKNHLFY
jgi:hypothetical protein